MVTTPAGGGRHGVCCLDPGCLDWRVRNQAGLSVSVLRERERERTPSRDTLNLIVVYQSRVVDEWILRQWQSSPQLEEGLENAL